MQFKKSDIQRKYLRNGDLNLHSGIGSGSLASTPYVSNSSIFEPHLFWGNEFDGQNDVDGDIKLPNNIFFGSYAEDGTFVTESFISKGSRSGSLYIKDLNYNTISVDNNMGIDGILDVADGTVLMWNKGILVQAI